MEALGLGKSRQKGRTSQSWIKPAKLASVPWRGHLLFGTPVTGYKKGKKRP